MDAATLYMLVVCMNGSCGPARYPPRYSMSRDDCETEAQMMRLNSGYDARCCSSLHDQIAPDKRDRGGRSWSE
jgi:hypothetical protein